MLTVHAAPPAPDLRGGRRHARARAGGRRRGARAAGAGPGARAGARRGGRCSAPRRATAGSSGPTSSLLLAALAAVAAVAPTAEIAAAPGLLVLLVLCVAGLDLIRVDVFERINLSPASVPALALAFIFGPLGPIAAELAIAVTRIVRRVPPVKWAFDVGALGLAGAAAAAIWAAAAPGPAAAELAVGVAAALAAYAVTSLLLPAVMWLARGDRPLAAWREQLAWLWPHYVGFGLLAGLLVECRAAPGAGRRPRLRGAGPAAVGRRAAVPAAGRGRRVRVLRERNAELERANVRIRELLGTPTCPTCRRSRRSATAPGPRPRRRRAHRARQPAVADHRRGDGDARDRPARADDRGGRPRHRPGLPAAGGGPGAGARALGARSWTRWTCRWSSSRWPITTASASTGWAAPTACAARRSRCPPGSSPSPTRSTA